VFWILLFGTTWLLSRHALDLSRILEARWIVKYPAAWQLPVERRISGFMQWLVEDAHFGLFSFRDVTRFVASVIELPYDLVRNLLIDGFSVGLGNQAVEIGPSLSWIAIVVMVTAFGHFVRDWKLAALVGGCFLYLAVFGQWDSAMVTLASVLIAVPFGAVGGLLLGVLAYRAPAFEALIRPVLDLMQTVPVFAYLVPILFLFGFGPVAALVATIIYAMPPMVRVTIVALRGVSDEIRDVGVMVGCTRRQLMWKVLIPTAAPTLMVGVNQVIMLTLNMVIIASMIGAGGLGFDVLSALRRLDIGGGIEAGVAIVVMAIALDRLSQAFATRVAGDYRLDPNLNIVQRHPWSATVLIVTVVTYLLSSQVPGIQSFPEAAALSTGTFWSDVIGYINVHFFDTFEAIKTAFLTYLLLPVKRFFTGIPWAWGIMLVTLIGWRVGGIGLAALAGSLTALIAAVGLWDKAMITLYLCGTSVLVASAIGIPMGILAARNDTANRVIGSLIDTLQTLPSFVYLIPVVMLFRVGDFSAMIAVVLYAMAPAVRYAAHGIRNVNPQLIEAGMVSGCTPRQLLWRIRLPMAFPELLLGLNQTIMLALSMLVITALVGTRDLGQEVYIALTKANTGQGIVAGLAVAFIAIIADRILTATTRRARRNMGLDG